MNTFGKYSLSLLSMTRGRTFEVTVERLAEFGPICWSSTSRRHLFWCLIGGSISIIESAYGARSERRSPLTRPANAHGRIPVSHKRTWLDDAVRDDFRNSLINAA